MCKNVIFQKTLKMQKLQFVPSVAYKFLQVLSFKNQFASI